MLLTLNSGKIIRSEEVVIPDKQIMKCIEGHGYKYLGILENAVGH